MTADLALKKLQQDQTVASLQQAWPTLPIPLGNLIHAYSVFFNEVDLFWTVLTPTFSFPVLTDLSDTECIRRNITDAERKHFFEVLKSNDCLISKTCSKMSLEVCIVTMRDKGMVNRCLHIYTHDENMAKQLDKDTFNLFNKLVARRSIENATDTPFLCEMICKVNESTKRDPLWQRCDINSDAVWRMVLVSRISIR